jgi:hypothetical protein
MKRSRSFNCREAQFNLTSNNSSQQEIGFWCWHQAKQPKKRSSFAGLEWFGALVVKAIWDQFVGWKKCPLTARTLE